MITLLLVASPMAVFGLAILVVIGLIVLGAIYWGANKILAAFGIGDPIRSVVSVLIVLLGLFFIVYYALSVLPTK